MAQGPNHAFHMWAQRSWTTHLTLIVRAVTYTLVMKLHFVTEMCLVCSLASAWTRPWQASQQGSKFFWDEDVEAAMDDYTSLRWNEMDAWKREQTDKIAKRKKVSCFLAFNVDIKVDADDWQMVKVYELWEHQVAKMHATQAESIREERLKGYVYLYYRLEPR